MPDAEGDSWRVLAAAVRGGSHEKLNLPCQDAFDYRVLPNGILLAAVADGAGSAPLADVGATLAAESALTSLAESLAATSTSPSNAEQQPTFSFLREESGRGPESILALLRTGLHAALAAIENEAQQRGVTSRDLATTLLLVAAGPEGIAAAQVGDGAIVFRTDCGELKALTRPPETEYANATSFLIAESAIIEAQFCVEKNQAAQIALFSDGLQRLALKLPEGAPHAPFFTPLFQFASTADGSEGDSQLAAFLSSPRIRERAEDDLTLLLATRNKPVNGNSLPDRK